MLSESIEDKLCSVYRFGICHQIKNSNRRSLSTAWINTQVRVKIFSYASWKNGNISESAGSQATDIGLYLQFQIAQVSCSVMIQAYVEHVPSPLQASRRQRQLFFSL